MIPRLPALVVVLLAPWTTLAVDTRSSDSSRPRGVGPEFAKFYKQSPSNTFACISNPAHIIPFSQVNDDFCDCPDGSDEPGTSACSYLSSLSPPQPRPRGNLAPSSNASLALPGFYCKNKGHIPAYVRFEAVNDGICDYEVCCDGSDEFAHVGGLVCEDRCAAIGKEYKKQEEVRQKSLGKAMKRRKEIQSDSQKVKKELEDKIEALRITIQGLERKVGEAEHNLKETEQREKLRAVRSDAAGRGKGRLGVLLTLSRDRIVELRNTLIKTREQRNSMVARVRELEGLLSSLKEQYNPNFNDAGVKTAVQGWEDYAARDTNDVWTDAEDRDVDAISKEDGPESGVNFAEFESSDEDEAASDAAAIYSLTSYLPPSLQLWVSGTIASVRQILIDNGILPDDKSGGGNVAESASVKSARQARDDAQRDLTNSNNDLNNAKSDLEKDYGPFDGILRSLKDQCVSVDSGEYTYSHCFMQKTTQKPKRGGSETNMGNFQGFEIDYVDDIVPADGKGLGQGDRIVLTYSGGQSCWNGPQRSTRVIMACWEENQIWKVSESEKCVYRMEFGTPAVCGWEKPPENGHDAQNAQREKDEL